MSFDFEALSNLISNVIFKSKQHELRQYATNPNIRARWDSLQREYSCCGGRNQGTGYTDWEGLDVDPLPYQALEFRVSKMQQH